MSPFRNPSPTGLIVASFLGFLALIGGIVIGVAYVVPDSANAFAIISPLLTIMGISVPIFVGAIVNARTNETARRETQETARGNLVAIERVASHVETVASDLNDLANGPGDRKIQANVKKALDDRAQQEEDST